MPDPIEEILEREAAASAAAGDNPPPHPPPAPDVINFKEHFEPLGFKDLDSVKGRLEILKGVSEDVLPEIPKIKDYREKASKYDELSQEHEKIKNQLSSFNPYSDDEDLFRYYEIKKKSPQEAEFFKQLAFGAPEPIDVIKADLKSKFPELANDQAMLDRKLERLYPGLFPADQDTPVDKTSKSYLNAVDDIKLDASKVKRELLAKYDIKPPQKETPEQINQRKAESQKLWEPLLSTINQELSKIKIEVPEIDKPEEKRLFEIEIPKEILETQVNLAKNFIIGNASIKPDEKGKAFLTTLVRNSILSQNASIIAEHIYKTVNTELNKKYKSLVQNNQNYNRQNRDETDQFGAQYDERKTIDAVKNSL